MDLPVWQTLYEELGSQNFVVVAVALESRGAEGAREWIEKADPTYPCLIDEHHKVAALYNMINVPQAVWIDEQGLIVRPTETAGATEGFRKMDPKTFKMPEAEVEKAKQTRRVYLDAIRDWVAKGQESEFVFDKEEVRARTPAFTQEVATANALFRLGEELVKRGEEKRGFGVLEEAAELNPDAWSIWRQKSDLEEKGKAMGMEFWQRVQSLGNKRYYAPVDMKGIPE